MKLKIYFKRKTSSRSAATSVLKDRYLVAGDLIHRDERTGLIAVIVYTEQPIDFIESHAQVAYVEEIK